MMQHAQAANTRLLQNLPKGFALGGEHAPHVTVLQRYVNTADLDKVYAAAGEVFAKENPTPPIRTELENGLCPGWRLSRPER
jgi:hypothetical protein